MARAKAFFHLNQSYMSFSRNLRSIVAGFAVATTAACSVGGDALRATVDAALPKARNVDSVPLDPRFRYIRTTHSGKVGFAWLGHVEKTPEGPVEVYYSSSGEVLRIANGRIVGAAGLPTEWRRVAVPRTPWVAIAKSDTPVALIRSRDVMPGYRYNITDELVVREISPLQSSALRKVDPQSLTWFEERVVSGTAESIRRLFVGADHRDSWLPPARYAVDLRSGNGEVVYAEQCLARDLCITWQRWSADMQEKQTRTAR